MSKSNKRAAVILAAGKSTRMKSSRSKVLHEVGGLSMLAWVTKLAKSAGAEKIVAVVNGGPSDVRTAAEDLGLEIAVQDPQLGTGHAVLAAKEQLEGFEGDLVVLYADTPFMRVETLADVFDARDKRSDIVVVGFEPSVEHAYGRLIVENGELTKIVEAKEANAEELAVNLCNSGVMAASCKDIFAALDQVTNDNAKGEYYLTDIVGIMRGEGKSASAILAGEDEVLGVDSKVDLAKAEKIFQSNKRREMLADGVILRDPDSTYFSHDTQIEADADIGANVVFGPGVTIAGGAVIHPFCHLEGARVSSGSQIGPFARLRPGAQMGENSKAGNFVEVKKAIVGKGSKINHLSYIGDAEIGEGSNIGAGTITCNYDGFHKSKTTIGDGVFVGTHSSLVAPVTIGSGAYLATGGVITKDVPNDALAVGRARQENKEGWAKRFRDAMKKRKSK
ncbi:MAG: bifunctional UDP-N-acetylglucosamine diphosphorylase/glucosamine-1-phosphate N-acetyltransferase GlmU [Acidimicrobiales bacterium]|nr:bifunctional UDP-N-acetylglucosamine diphosphorylase/glucosamine-1-phosphate N-acetyltransferase GlmU [Hyphomonadaceae bacterium]RZV39717.1 MAG: bifunctional UDP-N-acetylglucosamine diphosphorylase/glucosamine-1-phosphate N-acetyltransferase GlmU [Acidimicrobiales bacterium]